MSTMNETQQQVLDIIPIVTGSLSIVGSSCIIYIVATKRKKNKVQMTTYHRLLLAMSVLDVLFSSQALFRSSVLPSVNAYALFNLHAQGGHEGHDVTGGGDHSLHGAGNSDHIGEHHVDFEGELFNHHGEEQQGDHFGEAGLGEDEGGHHSTTADIFDHGGELLSEEGEHHSNETDIEHGGEYNASIADHNDTFVDFEHRNEALSENHTESEEHHEGDGEEHHEGGDAHRGYEGENHDGDQGEHYGEEDDGEHRGEGGEEHHGEVEGEEHHGEGGEEDHGEEGDEHHDEGGGVHHGDALENLLNAETNVQGCDAVGFLTHMGVGVAGYNAALSLYYFLVICRRMQPDKIAKTVEPFLHASILLYVFGTATASIFMGLFNVDECGLMCYIAPYPYNCVDNDDIECIRGGLAEEYIWWFSFGELLCFFVVIVVCQFAIFWTVRTQIGTLRRYSTSSTSEEPSKWARLTQCCKKRPQSAMMSEQNKKTREVAIQATLYVLVFVLTWFFVVLTRVAHLVNSDAIIQSYVPLAFIVEILFPLQGFLNFLVYLRPIYRKYRTVNKEVVSWKVLKASLLSTDMQVWRRMRGADSTATTAVSSALSKKGGQSQEYNQKSCSDRKSSRLSNTKDSEEFTFEHNKNSATTSKQRAKEAEQLHSTRLDTSLDNVAVPSNVKLGLDFDGSQTSGFFDDYDPTGDYERPL